uniref:START domain-containing protein n=1 Tax=Globisporangium ultimum (strain ATCC 200006 / CBS 805.95 / DAOM BR144) TaxID=431595 RepID=K3X3B0_GLOUD
MEKMGDHHTDDLLFDAHTLSELMEIDAMHPHSPSTSASNASPAGDSNDDGDGDSSDAFADAMLFQDIEALLISQTAGDSASALLHPQHHLMEQLQMTPTAHLIDRHHDHSGAVESMDWDMNVTHADESLAARDEENASDHAPDQAPAANEQHTREKELLQRELTFLQAQRDFLQFKADAAAAAVNVLEGSEDAALREQAELEKQNLETVTRQQQMLMELVTQQQKSLHDLELLLVQSPLNHYRMTLMTPMESYIKLGRDPIERRAQLLAMRDEKIDAVRQYIEYQARDIDPQREFFYLDTFEKFGKFYTVDFSVSQLNRTTIADVVDIIQDHFVTSNDGISQMLGCVTNREFFDGMDETFLNARIVDRVDIPKRHLHDRGFVVQESNCVFYRKTVDGDMAVMMCDYVDDDEWHPYRKTGRIRKDISVGITLSPYVNAEGAPCVIMKRFSFIKHHFNSITPTPEILQAISTRVILWGQAMRFCITKRRRGNKKSVFVKYSFPRPPPGAAIRGAAAPKSRLMK